VLFATENDTLNGVAMLLGTLVSQTAPCFHDEHTFWSPQAMARVTGWQSEGLAAVCFIHLNNSGATALDCTGESRDAQGQPVLKPFWDMTQADISACLAATDWCCANYGYYRVGGFSSHFATRAQMPVTMLRANIVAGVRLVVQMAEGSTLLLPEAVQRTLDDRIDRTWPTALFAPRLTGEGAFHDVYGVVANWGTNHGVTVYGHVGAELLTLCAMLRIPVNMHNVPPEAVFRPHSWAAYGTANVDGCDSTHERVRPVSRLSRAFVAKGYARAFVTKALCLCLRTSPQQENACELRIIDE
jgi:L-fucose isomerase